VTFPMVFRFLVVPSPQSIAFMEILPIVLAAYLWGGGVQYLCDNRSVVDAITAGTAPSPPLMHLLRSLTRSFSFSFSFFRHTPGRSNSAADALSCFRF
jgi:hypothetical protein